MTTQAPLLQPYVVVYATHTTHPTDPSSGGWAAIVRRGDRFAPYGVHACHATRNTLTAACLDFIQVTFDMGRASERPDVVWVSSEATATTEEMRADLAIVRAMALQYATVPCRTAGEVYEAVTRQQRAPP